jgi:hypothetical protein
LEVEDPLNEKNDLSESLEASNKAQAKALAASFPGDDQVSEPEVPSKSEHAELRAHQREIDKMVAKLPPRVREQMVEEFRAHFTRIQKLDVEKFL